MPKTTYKANKVLDHSTGKTAWTMPTVYIGLYTTATTIAGGGTEVSGGAYARVLTSGATWNAASAGSVANATAITFPTATGSWGTVTNFATLDASTAGNMLDQSIVTTSKTIGTGDTASFAAGSLVLTET